MTGFLNKKVIGLDIADQTIEAAELIKDKNQFKIISLGRISLPTGLVVNGQIKNSAALLKMVRQALAQAKPQPIIAQKVVFGLSESQVYIHVFTIKPHNIKQRNDLIFKEAQASIPLSDKDLLFTYSILAEEETGMRVLIAAINKHIFKEWQDFFIQAHLTVEYFDLELLANFRGLFLARKQTPIAIADIGSNNTALGVFTDKGLDYSFSLPIAGETMTIEAAKYLKITNQQAEQLKIQYGLADRKQQIFFILSKIIKELLTNIKANLDYYQQKTGQEIKGLVLIGGSSKLKGIVEYFKQELVLPIWLGESTLLPNRGSLEFIEAIGLALRSLDQDRFSRDLTMPKDSLLNIKQTAEFLESQKDESNALAVSLGVETIKKLRREKIILLIVLMAGIILILSADWYRERQRVKRLESLDARIEHFLEKLSSLQFQTILPNSQLPASLVDEVKEEIKIDNLKNQEPPVSEILEPRLSVSVKQTPTGWLNVRQGPGTNYHVLRKIYAEEIYPLLQENGDWFKIELDNGEVGWIYAQYAGKIK